MSGPRLGVIVGVGAVALTGWLWLDPLLALLVASNIVWTGWQLVRRSASGLMDEVLPADQQAAVVAVPSATGPAASISTPCAPGRLARVVSSRFHILVPGAWSVQRAHDLPREIEAEIRNGCLPHASVLTHLEPLEDPVSAHDIELDRPPRPMNWRTAATRALLAGTLMAASAPVLAWNAAGHRLTATIAWQAMDAETRTAAGRLLAAHLITPSGWHATGRTWPRGISSKPAPGRTTSGATLAFTTTAMRRPSVAGISRHGPARALALYRPAAVCEAGPASG